jgi:hypothetical protein
LLLDAGTDAACPRQAITACLIEFDQQVDIAAACIGPRARAEQQHTSDLGPATTAVTRRITSRWYGLNRISQA